MNKKRIVQLINGLMVFALLTPLAACQSQQYAAASPERAQASNDALKASLQHRPPSPAVVTSLLIDGEYEKVEEIYGSLLKRYADDITHESALQKAFDLFETGRRISPSALDAWVEATGSAFAHAARGYYTMGRASDARGNDYIKNTPKSNLTQMQQYCDIAVKDLRTASEKNPELSPVWVGLVRISMIAAMPFSPDDVFEEAIEHNRRSHYLRAQYIKSLEPRWGGSHQAMAGFAMWSTEDVDLNPRFWSLLGEVYADMASYYSHDGDHQRAAELYAEALQYGDKLQWLQYRAYSLINAGDFDQAEADLERIFLYSPHHGPALTMMNHIEQARSTGG